MINHKKFVDFDPSNPEHRKAVYFFLQRNAWGDSPFRFSHDPGFGSIAEQVKEKLLRWYLSTEEQQWMPTTAINQQAATGAKELAFQMMGIASEYKV